MWQYKIGISVRDWQNDCESFRKNPNPEPSFHIFKLISKIPLRGERACQKWFLVTVTFLAPAIFQTVRLEKPLFYSKFWRSLLNFALDRFLIFDFLPKSGQPGFDLSLQAKISMYKCIFLMRWEPLYLGQKSGGDKRARISLKRCIYAANFCL